VLQLLTSAARELQRSVRSIGGSGVAITRRVVMSPRPRKSGASKVPEPPAELLYLLNALDRPAWQATAAFKDSLCSYVGTLKANGLPPERMLAAVKELLRTTQPALDSSLAEQAVKWCIEAYYRPD
jgi:hypothetical protein